MYFSPSMDKKRMEGRIESRDAVSGADGQRSSQFVRTLQADRGAFQRWKIAGWSSNGCAEMRRRLGRH